MVASGDDIESVCEVLSGNLKEGSEKEEDEGSAEGESSDIPTHKANVIPQGWG